MLAKRFTCLFDKNDSDFTTNVGTWQQIGGGNKNQFYRYLIEELNGPSSLFVECHATQI